MHQGRTVAKRAEKLEVFYTGEDQQHKAVWNGGNMYRTSTKRLQELLSCLGEETTWARIQERYRSKVSHVYRGENCKCNRHGHSNELPSFFAFGHDCLTSFVAAVTQDAWVEYQGLHIGCCGVADALACPERFKDSIESRAAKQERRYACQNDQKKLNAAIDAKKARRAKAKAFRHSNAPRFQTPQPTKSRFDAAATGSDTDDDDSDSDM